MKDAGFFVAFLCAYQFVVYWAVEGLWRGFNSAMRRLNPDWPERGSAL